MYTSICIYDVREYLCVYVTTVCMCMHLANVCMHVLCIHTIYVCFNECLYVCMYVCVNVYIYVLPCTKLHMYVFKYVCMYVCEIRRWVCNNLPVGVKYSLTVNEIPLPSDKVNTACYISSTWCLSSSSSSLLQYIMPYYLGLVLPDCSGAHRSGSPTTHM